MYHSLRQILTFGFMYRISGLVLIPEGLKPAMPIWESISYCLMT